jgi:anti-sigma factor RsiW
MQPSDDQLSAWLDGELGAAEQAAVDAWLRDHPDDAARARLLAADRDALRSRFEPVLDEPLPERLQAMVRDGGRRAAGASAAAGALSGPRGWGARLGAALAGGQPWRQAAAVAGLLVCGGVVGGTLVWRFPPAQASLAARLSAQGGWVHRAAVAHAVYAPEVRHPVEVNVVQGSVAEQKAQEEHLARWLSKRLGLPVRLFDLRPQGFELVGGRLLPDATGPSAQLMYQNAAGQRATVYLRRPEAGADTSFSFARDGELAMFFWVEDGFGCAVVGKLPREQLLALGDAVYKQAEAEAAARPAEGASAPTSPPPARPGS